VGIDEVSLELLHLLLVQNHLGKLSDTSVHTVHDLLGDDLAFQEGTTLVDALYCILVYRYRLSAPGHLHHVFSLQRMPIQHYDHTFTRYLGPVRYQLSIWEIRVGQGTQ